MDKIKCKICGEMVTRIYGAHLKKHGMTSKEYKEKFPGEPLMSKKDLKNTTKNSGKHMKQNKYKKMFSEMFSGENNPNHKSKTTEQERKERSPFSKEFYKKRGVENIDKVLVDFRNKSFKNRNLDTRIEYYLNQGYDLKTSRKMLKDRQSTFSLEKCIKKYGEIDGIKKYTERQEKWQKSLNEGGNIKHGYSKISQILFDMIIKYYDESNIDKDEVFYATKNSEYRLPKKSGGVWLYDFVDLDRMKIIEYNGDEYHANPLLYESDDCPHPFRKNITSKEIWDKDSEKYRVAKENGFEVLVVWDSEFRKDGEIVTKKCLDFLFK